jgi:hypothetical protein
MQLIPGCEIRVKISVPNDPRPCAGIHIFIFICVDRSHSLLFDECSNFSTRQILAN